MYALVYLLPRRQVKGWGAMDMKGNGRDRPVVWVEKGRGTRTGRNVILKPHRYIVSGLFL